MTADSKTHELQAAEPLDDQHAHSADTQQSDADQQRMRELYEQQLRRMQCRGGGCGEGVFLG